MQAYEGYVEGGQFYPIGQAVRAYGRRRAFLTVLDEPAQEKSAAERKVFWSEIDRMVDSAAGEELPDFPRVSFGRNLVTFEEG